MRSSAASDVYKRQAPLFTPRQIDDARNSAAQALADARNPENGRPLFPTIIHMAETYRLDPAREGYPDLIALPDDPYWVRTKFTPGSEWVEADANLPGTHRPEGIVALAGTGLSPGRHLQANLRDVTPTILQLLGVSIPEHVEGTPIGAATEKFGSPADFPKTRVDAPDVTVSGPHQPQFEYSAEEQAIIEQRLADLGYLE